MVQSEFVDWLLNANTPTIRYLTLREVMHVADSDPQLQAAQQAIMTEGPVPAMLEKQAPTGQWGHDHSYYTPKYVSTHWTLTLLTELCVDPSDLRFQRGVEYMLAATAGRLHDALTADEQGWTCLWGNILRYALYAGRTADVRLQAIVEYVVKDIRDGDCHCRANDYRSCSWGVVRSLWGLAALPQVSKRMDITAAIEEGLHFMLDSYRLVDANYPISDFSKVHPMWFKLNSPLFYQADILFTLRTLAELNKLDHPRAVEALDWLESQRLTNGRWRGSSPFRQRTWHELGDSEETSRWVSLQAAILLERAGRKVYDTA